MSQNSPPLSGHAYTLIAQIFPPVFKTRPYSHRYGLGAMGGGGGKSSGANICSNNGLSPINRRNTPKNVLALCCEIGLECHLVATAPPNERDTMNKLENELVNTYTANGGKYHRTSRYWGIEVEHPRAGDYAHLLGSLMRDCKQDGTIPNLGGNCQCSECGHSCTCSECPKRWGSGCNMAGNNEVSTMPSATSWGTALDSYIMALALTQEEPEDYEEWCNDCQGNCGDDYDCSCTDLSNWGMHTHVDARDLTLQNIASVMRLAGYIFQQFEDAFGIDHYNHHAREQDILEMLGTGQAFGRTSVNPCGALQHLKRPECDRQEATGAPYDNQKATIEFRQFRWTPVQELAEARTATARAIVDYVKAGKPMFYLLREKNFAVVLETLEPWKH